MADEIKCEQVGILSGGKWDKCHEANRRVYLDTGLSPTITTMGGGQREPKIIEKVELVKYGSYYTWKDKQGKINTQCNRASDVDGYSLTIPACDNTPKIIEPIAYDEQNGYIRQDGCIGTLTTDGSSPKHNNRVVEPNYRFFEQAFETLKENHCEVGDTIDAYNKRVNKDGISPTITTRPEGFKTAILPVVPTIWGSKQKNCAKKKDGICPTLTSAMGDGGGQIPMHNYDYRIRKLTERECGRLMGVKGEDCEKIAKNQSTSSQYHLYGDSIVTTCLMAIFGELFEIDYETKINNLIGELKQ